MVKVAQMMILVFAAVECTTNPPIIPLEFSAKIVAHTSLEPGTASVHFKGSPAGYLDTEVLDLRDTTGSSVTGTYFLNSFKDTGCVVDAKTTKCFCTTLDNLAPVALGFQGRVVAGALEEFNNASKFPGQVRLNGTATFDGTTCSVWLFNMSGSLPSDGPQALCTVGSSPRRLWQASDASEWWDVLHFKAGTQPQSAFTPPADCTHNQ